MTFGFPWAAAALLPWAWLVWRAARRGRVARTLVAPLWTLRASDGQGWDPAPLRRRDAAWWWLVASALVAILAATDPRWSPPGPAPDAGDVLLDAGLAHDAPSAVDGLAAARWWGAGLVDPGPHPSLDALRAVAEDPRGATLGEILVGLGPDPEAAVTVVAFSAGPTDHGDWSWIRVPQPPRLHTVTRDATGRIEWSGHSLDGLQLEVGAQSRPVSGGSAQLGSDDAEARLRVPGSLRAVDLPAPPPRRVYLVAGPDDPWADVVRTWPGVTVRMADRARLPDARDWTAWFGDRGGEGLLVVVGDAPPAWPTSGWLWIAPRAGTAPGIRGGAGDADLDFAWEGLSLHGWERARPLASDARWSRAASGRVLHRRGAAILNLALPWGEEGRWADAAVASWRLARRLQPPARTWAGPGPPSPPVEWPVVRQAPASTASTPIAALWWIAGLLAVVAGWSWGRTRRDRALVMGVVAASALAMVLTFGPRGGVLAVLDASPSCRAALPAAFADWRREAGDAPCGGVLALDGESARWWITPGGEWPEDPDAWIRERIEGLPAPGTTRWSAALRQALARVEADRVVVFSDGGFEDDPSTLKGLLPATRLEVRPLEAGRPGDAAILGTADRAGAMVVRLDPGRGDRTLMVHTRDATQTFPATDHEVVVPRTREDPPVRLALGGEPDPWPQNDTWIPAPPADSAPRLRWVGAGRPRDATSAWGRPDVWILADATSAEVADVDATLRADLAAGAGLVVLSGPAGFLATEPDPDWPLRDLLPVRGEVAADATGPPTTWMFLLDVSGSMAQPAGSGSRMDEARLALAAGLAATGPEDAVGLVAFADRPLAILPPRTGRTAADLTRALSAVGPSGGTALTSALAAARAEATTEPVRLVVLTDGLTRGEESDTWIDQVSGARCDVLELGTEGSAALRRLATATGGHHATATDFGALGRILARDVVGEEPARLADPVRLTAVAGWRGALPRGPVQVLRMSVEATAAAVWTAGEDPALVLADRGAARVAVLATSPGAPWAESEAAWSEALGRVVDWAARRTLPSVEWPAGGSPRITLPGGGWSSPARLHLRDAQGHLAPLDPVGGGVYRPREVATLRAPVAVVAGPEETMIARVHSQVADEWRQRGVEASRLAALARTATTASVVDRRVGILALMAWWACMVWLVLRPRTTAR